MRPQNLKQEEEPAGSTTDALIPRSRPQPPMLSNAEMLRTIQEVINRNPWMSQLLTEEARRGWLVGTPDSPPAGPSGTHQENIRILHPELEFTLERACGTLEDI